MTVQIYAAAQGLSEKPPKLVEFEKVMKQTVISIVDEIQKKATEVVEKKYPTKEIK